MHPFSGNLRPDLLTSLMNMSLVLGLPLRIVFKRSTPPKVFEIATKPSRFADFWPGAQSLAPATRNDIQTSKSGALYLLTSKCFSRHNGVHFFNISTSKRVPKLTRFVHFDFEMCFAPQRRALLRHLNFEHWSEYGALCTFWLRNVLRATTACTFSTSQLPKVFRGWHVFVHFNFEMCSAPQRRAKVVQTWLRNVLRDTTACTFSTSQLPKVFRGWRALYILTSKCASRHNGVHFFNISTSKSVPRLTCFLTSKCASRHNGVHFALSEFITIHPQILVSLWAGAPPGFSEVVREGFSQTHFTNSNSNLNSQRGDEFCKEGSQFLLGPLVRNPGPSLRIQIWIWIRKVGLAKPPSYDFR